MIFTLLFQRQQNKMHKANLMCIAHNQFWCTTKINYITFILYSLCTGMCLNLQHFYMLAFLFLRLRILHSEAWTKKLILMLSASALSRGKSSLYVNRSPSVSVETPDCSLKAQPLPGDPLTSVAWALQGKQLPDQHATQVWLVFLLYLQTSIKTLIHRAKQRKTTKNY